MKKNIKLVFSLFAVLALIGCSTSNQEETSKLEPPASTSAAPSSQNDTSASSSKESQSQSSSRASSSESSSDGSNTSSSETTKVYYQVTFQNYDGTVLDTQEVLEGSEAVYAGETPTKEDDEDYTYKFIGWDKEDDLKAVSADLSVVAQFEATGIWSPIYWF